MLKSFFIITFIILFSFSYSQEIELVNFSYPECKTPFGVCKDHIIANIYYKSSIPKKGFVYRKFYDLGKVLSQSLIKESSFMHIEYHNSRKIKSILKNTNY
jgi:hypothetical protein